ncbi:MAG: GHMP kinase [Candidatus Bathyarchaeota archaeon]|jgi:pantoate kinase
MREASAFAPGHLTGFFQICDEPDDPLLKGSRGAGFSIAQGIHTEVMVEPAESISIQVKMNGAFTKEAVVSENVAKRMLSKSNGCWRLEITHEIGVPIGAGFGSSGGGAITLALALNEVLELGLSYVEVGRVAHVAEIECKTGLGTVFAVTQGGFGVLYRPGAPGVGEALKYGRSNELSCVYLHFGPISTAESLSDPRLRERINALGGRFVDQFREDLNPTTFMEFSRRFTEHVNIVTPRMKRVMDQADKAGFPCSMAMFGEALFSLVPRGEADLGAALFREAAPRRRVCILPVDDQGARLL